MPSWKTSTMVTSNSLIDLKEGSDNEKEDGEMDISVTDEISNKVSVWMAGQDKKGSAKAPLGIKDKLDLNLSSP